MLDGWAGGRVPAERWAALYPRIRRFPGSLPELLLAALDEAVPG
ncbi:hypothetical protein ACIRRH_38125 [Kitasatospora sp. NPDC101235]